MPTYKGRLDSKNRARDTRDHSFSLFFGFFFLLLFCLFAQITKLAQIRKHVL